MRHLLSILLLTVITFAAPVSKIFRFRIVYTDTNPEPQAEYLVLKDGKAATTKDPSQAMKTVTFPNPPNYLFYQGRQ